MIGMVRREENGHYSFKYNLFIAKSSGVTADGFQQSRNSKTLINFFNIRRDAGTFFLLLHVADP